MELRQGHHTFKNRFRSTLLSAALSGLWMALMSPAVEAAVLQSKSYEYDAQGRVTVEKDAANTVLVTHTYDAMGNRKTSTDALGRVTTNDYDALNRLKKVTVTANSVVQSVTEYGYDARDNLASVTDPRGLVTTYGYNGFDQLTTQTSPDTGVTSYTPNAAGQVTSRTNAASQATAYQYDALGRVTQASYADGRVVTYTYDQGTHGKGRLTGLSDSSSSLAWTYNADGNVLTRTQTIGTGQTAQSSTLTYAYNASGQLASLTMPSGAVIGYTYDDQGRVASLTRDAVTILSNIQYRPFGGITGWTWGNGQLHTRTYDQNGRLDLLSVGGTVHDLNYDIVSRIDDLADLADSSKNKDFSYDALDRLIGYTGQNSTRAWSYDAVGNRTAQSIGSTNETYSYASTSNRLQSLTNSSNSAQNRSYQYTSTGHTSSDGVNTFTYDARERLVSATTPSANASYAINPLGQRIKKSVTQGGTTTTTTFLYDEAGHLVAESDSTGVASEYVFLGDIPVAVNRTSVQNSQGTPIVLDSPAFTPPGWVGNAGTYSTTAGAYGGGYHAGVAQTGAPQGIFVDNDNANNVAPNSAAVGGIHPWLIRSNSGESYGTRLVRGAQQGLPQGIMVDDTEAVVVGPTSGSERWVPTACSANCQAGSYLRASYPPISAYVEWTANVTTAGTYNIYVLSPASQLGGSVYSVAFGGTSQNVTLAAGTNLQAGQWSLLGSYSVPVGPVTVTLSKANNPARNDFRADAILVADPNAPKGYFNTITWTANVPEAGAYNVYANVARVDAAGQAKYTISHAGGSTVVTATQTIPNTAIGWLSLGSFTFNAGLTTVSVSDQGVSGDNAQGDAIVIAKPDAPIGYVNYVTWTPTLPSAGNYEVQVWRTTPKTEHAPSPTVWYRIDTASGSVKVVQNQTQNLGQWVSLGTYSLDPATAKVGLADYGVIGKRVIADAVRFIPINNSTSSALYYVHPDHLNTPRQLTTSDAQNTVVWRWDSEPFGSTLADADPDQNGQAIAFNLRFPGQYFDAETQLHYNYFRDYASSIGRYIESDPIGLNGGVNTYSYADSSPVIFNDPTGLLKWKGSYRLRSGGYGKLGGVSGTFILNSECDIDGFSGTAEVSALSTSFGVGLPLGETSGEVEFSEPEIRVNGDVFSGDFRVNGLGFQFGPWVGASVTTIWLGRAVSTDEKDTGGFDISFQIGVKGVSKVEKFEKVCGCKK
ncbi:MAG: type secretion protein Rhs [Moraxellaceae bacterium]|jgi:RHS repeat-associated protein|nr:type secretion protein Rhs [Moraxellaceae bacterium]